MDVVRDELRDEKGVFCVQTIGFFDGVHIGHRYLLEQVRELALAEGMPSMVVTFRQHPASVLRPEEDVRVLSTLDEKLAKIDSALREERKQMPLRMRQVLDAVSLKHQDNTDLERVVDQAAEDHGTNTYERIRKALPFGVKDALVAVPYSVPIVVQLALVLFL